MAFNFKPNMKKTKIVKHANFHRCWCSNMRSKNDMFKHFWKENEYLDDANMYVKATNCIEGWQ